jgi:DNA-binding MarR family transcriptional regulator
VDDPEHWPLGRLLFTAARLVEHVFAAHLRDCGLTYAGFVALYVLTNGALSQRDLAARCQVEDQTMSRTVDRLERTGYVRRQRDDIDRRRVLVVMTEGGRRAFACATDVPTLDLLDEIEQPDVFRRQLAHLVHRLGDTRWPMPKPRRPDLADPRVTFRDALGPDDMPKPRRPDLADPSG